MATTRWRLFYIFNSTVVDWTCFFYDLLSTACAVLLPCTYQASIRLCAKHYAVKAVQLCAVAVRVWSLKLFMATDIGQWWRECHHTSTVRWQHSWTGSCLCGRLAEGGSCPDFRDLQISPLWLLPVRPCERRGVPSVSAYNPEHLEGSDTNSDKNLNSLCCKMFGTKLNSFLLGAGQQMEQILRSEYDIKMMCSLQRRALILCVTTFYQ